MSWTATICFPDGTEHCAWNYTHNTNPMVNIACGEQSWWRKLHGMDGAEGAFFLKSVAKALRDQPDLKSMNPPNGWGDYDTILDVIEEMSRSVPETPTHWVVYG